MVTKIESNDALFVVSLDKPLNKHTQFQMPTWSETYFRQDLFPSYLFSRRQFHAIVIFLLKSISDLDSGSLPRFFGEFIYVKLKVVGS